MDEAFGPTNRVRRVRQVQAFSVTYIAHLRAGGLQKAA